MINLETGEESSSGENAIPQSETSLFTHILRGGLLCLIFGVLDNLILHAGKATHWIGLTSYLAFGLFVVQSIVLSAIVGFNVRKHLIWWLFFIWSLGLVNLQLILIQFGAGEGYRFSSYSFPAFVYAFFAAQIGLIIFWAICGAYPRARIRLPLAAVTLTVACHPFWTLDKIASHYSAEQWLGLLTFFIVAAALTFGILRFLGFELGFPEESEFAEAEDAKSQFGIKHLFIWTTIVAVLFGIGGFVSWQAIFDQLFSQSFVINIGRTLLITVSLVACLLYTSPSPRDRG